VIHLILFAQSALKVSRGHHFLIFYRFSVKHSTKTVRPRSVKICRHVGHNLTYIALAQCFMIHPILFAQSALKVSRGHHFLIFYRFSVKCSTKMVRPRIMKICRHGDLSKVYSTSTGFRDTPDTFCSICSQSEWDHHFLIFTDFLSNVAQKW